MNDLLFDVPWWMPAFLALLGVVVFWNGNNRLNSKLRKIGISILSLAVIWFTVSYFVDTDKEKCEKGTRQLVDMVGKGQWDLFRSKLAQEVDFRVQGGNVYAEGSDKVADYAKAGANAIHLDSASVQSTYAEQTGTLITVTANISSHQSETNYPPAMNSSFQFDWELLNQGWAVREIRVMQIGTVRAREIDGFMRMVK